jgi:arginase
MGMATANAALAVIGAPSSAGAYAPGQERAPAAFRRYGLVAALRRAGLEVRDRGDVAAFRWRPDLGRPKAMNLDAVRDTALAVADRVAEAMRANEAVLVLGGDCTVELGTVAGAIRDGSSVGLVYIDLDGDLNAPETSDGALDWTGVAHLLDLPGVAGELAGLGTRRPMLSPSQILYLGADAITPPETATADALGLERIGLAAIRTSATAAGERAAAWGATFDRLLVHLDVDVLSFTSFPIAENVRREDGLTLAELSGVLAPLVHASNWRSLTVAEVNPDHAPDETASFAQLVEALSSPFRPVSA